LELIELRENRQCQILPLKNLEMTTSQLTEFTAKTGLTQVPSWATNKVLRPEEIDNYPFYFYQENSTNIQRINLDQIVGTTHPKYNIGSWVEMLLDLSRPNIRTVAQAYEAIVAPSINGDNVSLDKYGEEYVITSGNHRFCFAKFGSQKYINVRVTEYDLDFEAMLAHNDLSQYFDVNLKSRSQIEFKSDLIQVHACDRNEVLSFWFYFKQLSKNSVSFFDRLKNKLFPNSEKQYLRFMNQPIKPEQVLALLAVKYKN
jgi:hypothetical protein